MAIYWDYLTVEMILLFGIIYFSGYLKHWIHRRSQIREDEKTTRNIIRIIKDDLERRQSIIE